MNQIFIIGLLVSIGFTAFAILLGIVTTRQNLLTEALTKRIQSSLSEVKTSMLVGVGSFAIYFIYLVLDPFCNAIRFAFSRNPTDIGKEKPQAYALSVEFLAVFFFTISLALAIVGPAGKSDWIAAYLIWRLALFSVTFLQMSFESFLNNPPDCVHSHARLFVTWIMAILEVTFLHWYDTGSYSLSALVTLNIGRTNAAPAEIYAFFSFSVLIAFFSNLHRLKQHRR